ncbi:MAG: osmotically-inducible protein OsmY [Hyphomicrobiaceae bacterium]|jgi:osmotically-inducible protein OsmY
MRFGITLLALLALSGCTALAVGGGKGSQTEREAKVVASDSAITTLITGQLLTDTAVNVFKIGVRTYKGTVTLSGTVGNAAARDQAGYISKSTQGVIAVNNLIVVGN